MPKKCNQNLRFCDRKNIFSSNFLFFLKTYQICSILTKYEGITLKTPKVRLIFRFLRCSPRKNTGFEGFCAIKKNVSIWRWLFENLPEGGVYEFRRAPNVAYCIPRHINGIGANLTYSFRTSESLKSIRHLSSEIQPKIALSFD